MKTALSALAGLLLPLVPLFAQNALSTGAPTMDPGGQSETGSGEGKAKSPFGLLSKDRPKDAKTEITAEKEALFDNVANTAEFRGRVVVRDPQFTLTCDELKVNIRKDHKGMERAEAIGNVVIVQENQEANGEKTKSIGRSGRALYIPETGDITLTVWPQVQQKQNNQVATEESTRMILNRDGKSRTYGPSKTVIVDTGDSK